MAYDAVWVRRPARETRTPEERLFWPQLQYSELMFEYQGDFERVFALRRRLWYGACEVQ